MVPGLNWMEAGTSQWLLAWVGHVGGCLYVLASMPATAPEITHLVSTRTRAHINVFKDATTRIDKSISAGVVVGGATGAGIKVVVEL